MESPLSRPSHAGMPQLLALSLESYGPLMFLFGILAVVKSYIRHLWEWFGEYFTSTVHVKRSDETYDMLLAWISARGLDGSARSLLAQVGPRQGNQGHRPRDGKKALSFSPWNGSFLFWFRNSLLSYQTELKDIGFSKEEEISITSFGRSSELLRQFLEECRDEYLKQIQNKTTIFENRNDRWKKVATRTIRPLSTVIVNAKQKQQLFEDVKTFIAPDTRRWFVERNIPYRRGYLLYGPPGTGKSSFSFSVAGELGIDIYIVNIPDVNDQSLKDIFSELPQQCVVLLEDIDAAGIGRPSDYDDSDGGLPGSRKGVTMSGLLNTLDGVASQEGRVVIMTTNHIDNLDEALIRPGRVDKKVEFQFADADMTSQLFRFIYHGTGAASSDAEDDDEIHQLGAEFTSRVPELEFSPAHIMSFLLQHRQSPLSALRHTEEWVAASLLERRAKQRGTIYRARSSASEINGPDEPSPCGVLRVPPCSPTNWSTDSGDSLLATPSTPNESQLHPAEKPIWQQTVEEARLEALRFSVGTVPRRLASAPRSGSREG
ncbi:hypothetical protein HIM_11792 [Hirsutella minnesotensis 3608]|uniref:AAA+ ATPase domain-containing protein n=1 Tax=Hirsutella minnesotensis 3608 TaxID=1043627 RepID=A0A0F7ZR14_9HYPO|nr:hypothetical protein HIM_11792 [Hirsutella minnesotensis 3608]